MSSEYRATEQKWIHLTTTTSGLGGNEIRSIVVRKADDKASESVWFATSDGGVSKFEQGKWTVYRVEDGLPSNEVRAVAVDKHNRIWAGTSKGVVYFDGQRWEKYNTIDTLSIAFGPANCQNCPYDDDAIWTGTTSMGLTHSRVPYPNIGIDVLKVCFVPEKGEADCQSFSGVNQTDVITATYTKAVTPGETFRFEITVSPRVSYELREDRGDFLSYTEDSDANLFDAYSIIPVKGTIVAGQSFTFTDFDNSMKAPQLSDNEQEKTFVSSWRVWTHTRYAGPYIRIVFTVRKT